MISAIILIAKALLAALLWIAGLAACLLPFYDRSSRGANSDDVLPRLAGMDSDEFVRSAMLPDDVPMPGRDGIEEVHLDSLWNRRN